MRSETLIWVGGEDEFALSLPLLRALQSRCDAGIGRVYKRIASDDFYESDVLATIALGLEGGGMPKREAVKKVEALFEDYGLEPLRSTAFAVCLSAMQGWPKTDEEETSEGEGGEVPEVLEDIDFKSIWKTARNLGLSADDMEKTSLAEFAAYVEGHQEYHGNKPAREPEALSAEKLEELGIGQTFRVN